MVPSCSRLGGNTDLLRPLHLLQLPPVSQDGEVLLNRTGLDWLEVNERTALLEEGKVVKRRELAGRMRCDGEETTLDRFALTRGRDRQLGVFLIAVAHPFPLLAEHRSCFAAEELAEGGVEEDGCGRYVFSLRG